MKSTAKFLLFLGILFAVSCNQPIDMMTVVNADGSCYRVMSEYADSAFLTGNKSAEHNPFPVDIDPSWKLSWIYNNSIIRNDFPLSYKMYDSICEHRARLRGKIDRNSKDGILVLARRDYTSVEEMDQLFRFKKTNEWSKLNVKHTLDIKFRWFYSYYTYKETYPKIQTGFEIPIEKYMTKDESMFWFTGQPNILQGMNGIEIGEYMHKLEAGYNKWFQHNLWNDEYKALISNYDKLSNKPVSKESLAILRDSIFDSKVKSDKDFDMMEVLNDFFKTKAFSPLWERENSPLGKFEENYKSGFIEVFERPIDYKLMLPGKTIQSNDAVVHGDTLCWNLSAYRMIPADYTIEAQSRITNVWAFVLSGIALVVAIGGFVLKFKR